MSERGPNRMRSPRAVLSTIEREALTFACPWCSAQPGSWCLTEVWQVAVSLHQSRIDRVAA